MENRLKNRMITMLKSVRRMSPEECQNDPKYKEFQKSIAEEIGNVKKQITVVDEYLTKLRVLTQSEIEIGSENSESHNVASEISCEFARHLCTLKSIFVH